MQISIWYRIEYFCILTLFIGTDKILVKFLNAFDFVLLINPIQNGKVEFLWGKLNACHKDVKPCSRHSENPLRDSISMVMFGSFLFNKFSLVVSIQTVANWCYWGQAGMLFNHQSKQSLLMRSFQRSLGDRFITMHLLLINMCPRFIFFIRFYFTINSDREIHWDSRGIVKSNKKQEFYPQMTNVITTNNWKKCLEKVKSCLAKQRNK